MDPKHGKRWECSTCSKSFKANYLLTRHMVTHDPDAKVKCEMTHLEKSTRVVTTCDVCPRTFSCKTALQRHVRVVHENRRNYRSIYCGKVFPYSPGLKVHVEAKHVANKELIHSCDKCEYKSRSKYYLTEHKTRHNGVRHGCYFCEKKFLTFSHLVKHCGRHTLEYL